MALRISSGCTFLAGLCLAVIAPFSVVAQTLDNGDVVKGPTDSFDIPTNGLGSWIWAAEHL